MSSEFDIYKPMTDRSMLSEREKDLVQFAVALEHNSPMFKIRHFVGDAQVTPYAKYKQLMLEIRTREELIETMEMSVAKLEAEAALLEEDYERADERYKKVLIWDLKTKQNEALKTKRRLESAYDERSKYLLAVQEMYASGEAFLEDGTDLREVVLDPVRSEEMERNHWVYRLGKQAALDMISYGHIGTGNLEAISMMDERTATETLHLAITYSHGVKTALGKMEQGIIEAINRGEVAQTMKIENHKQPNQLGA
jgi:hypothetical protein